MMRLKIYKDSILILCVLVGTAACTNHDGWPALTDNVPSAKERERVIERVVPAHNAQIAEDYEIHSAAEARALFNDIQQMVQVEKQAYINARQGFSKALQEERDNAWFGLQLALTRLSQTSSRLDKLVGYHRPDADDLKDMAAALKLATDMFVIEERKILAELKPE